MDQPRSLFCLNTHALGCMVLPLMFAACTSTGEVAVKVDSISHQVVPITGKRLLVDLNEGAGNLFRENEIATKIMHTLAARGYAQAATLAEADYRLEFSYGFQKLHTPFGTGPAVLVGMGMGTTPRYKGHLALRVFFCLESVSTALGRRGERKPRKPRYVQHDRLPHCGGYQPSRRKYVPPRVLHV